MAYNVFKIKKKEGFVITYVRAYIIATSIIRAIK